MNLDHLENRTVGLREQLWVWALYTVSTELVLPTIVQCTILRAFSLQFSLVAVP